MQILTETINISTILELGTLVFGGFYSYVKLHSKLDKTGSDLVTETTFLEDAIEKLETTIIDIKKLYDHKFEIASNEHANNISSLKEKYDNELKELRNEFEHRADKIITQFETFDSKQNDYTEKELLKVTSLINDLKYDIETKENNFGKRLADIGSRVKALDKVVIDLTNEIKIIREYELKHLNKKINKVKGTK